MSTVIQENPVDVVCLGVGFMSGVVATELALAGNSVVGITKGPYWDYVNDYSTTKYDEWGLDPDRITTGPFPRKVPTIRTAAASLDFRSGRTPLRFSTNLWDLGLAGQASIMAGGVESL